MKLYNTLTQEKDVFTPRGNEVTIYVCGITPYDTTHLGHAFTYTTTDILIRYLEMQGLNVRYVQNVTDIDDDILRKAKEVGEDWRSLGNRWTTHFIRDMQKLNVRAPDRFPRATETIPEIIQSVQALLEEGVAYKADGSVYYAVDSWPEFGKLSHLPREEMLPIANERGNRPDDPNKRNPLDFVLWQAQAPGEPSWDSPWGPGRPGWHIECSSMSTSFLGDIVDIHGGGADLCFPHHECEIAQVEPASSRKPFVRYWMHTAMVRHEGEKMSKSLGNLVMVRDLLESYSADAIRLYLGRHHYRESWEFAEPELQASQAATNRLLLGVEAESGEGSILDFKAHQNSFYSAMDDDLQTGRAVTVMLELAETILTGVRKGMNVKEAQETLRSFGQVFGLGLDSQGPESRVVEGWERYITEFAY